MKVLLIGCGNIGAQYDIDNPTNITYASALFEEFEDVFIYEPNRELLEKTLTVYTSYKSILLDEVNWKLFDIICIASPTQTHFKYLRDIGEKSSAVVICEKPISREIDELNLLKHSVTTSNKIIVNYIRRFQPDYIELKKKLLGFNFFNEEEVRITITYCRGILNNGSHAFDLLEFLFDKKISFEKFQIGACKFDAFDTDPTINGIIYFDNWKIKLNGINQPTEPIFEIIIESHHFKLSILNSGNLISLVSKNENYHSENAIEGYMQHTIRLAKSMISNPNLNDNFVNSLELNEKIVSLIENL